MMYKKLLFMLLVFISAGVCAFAQSSGGVKGTVVDRSGRAPIPNAKVSVYSGSELIAEQNTGADGFFIFEDLDNGVYRMNVSAAGYVGSQVYVTVA